MCFNALLGFTESVTVINIRPSSKVSTLDTTVRLSESDALLKVKCSDYQSLCYTKRTEKVHINSHPPV